MATRSKPKAPKQAPDNTADSTADTTADEMATAANDSRPAPLEPMTRAERIRERAYEKFLARGSVGDETQDWLEAEAEIDAQDAAAP